MSSSITTSFINAYMPDLHQVFQRYGGMLRLAVRMKANVVGSTATFQKIGTGTATTKARHGAITPMNQTHTAPAATLVDFYAGDWVDALDEAATNIDERMAIARGGLYALGRKVDNQIITVLDGTTQTAKTMTVTSFASIKGTIIDWVHELDENDVPNDGNRFGAVTPTLYAQMMTVDSFASADYVGANGLPFKEGIPGHLKYKDWMGVKWCSHTGLPGVTTTTAKGFVWHKDAVGYASGNLKGKLGNVAENEQVAVDLTWHGDRAAHFLNHAMKGGAVLIDDTGVIEGTWNDTSAIATS